MRVQNRHRRDEPGHDERPLRRPTAPGEEAVQRGREGQRGDPPRQVDERIVPAPEEQRGPYLHERHGRRIVGRGVDVGGVPRLQPLGERNERHHRLQLEPHARLRAPLRPCVPRIQRAPEDLSQQQRVAQREPCHQRDPRRALPRGEVRAREIARDRARRKHSGVPRVAPREPGRGEHCNQHRQADRGDPEWYAGQRDRPHPERQQERAREPAAADGPCARRPCICPRRRRRHRRRRRRRDEECRAERPHDEVAEEERYDVHAILQRMRNSAEPGSANFNSAETIWSPSQRSRPCAWSNWTPCC